MRLLRGIGIATALMGGAASGQVVERHLPPAASGTPTQTLPQSPSAADDRPFGPALGAIAVLGSADPVLRAVSPGVDVGRIGVPRADRLARALRALLGRPLSLKLVADAEAVVTRHYRSAGRPFVTVTTPEQEVTAGALQLRVTEYRLGALRVSDASPGESERLRSHMRTGPGAPLSSETLAQDLDWLNRYPFRRVEAVFAPGQTPGTTDLTLATTHVRPWQAYGGYATSDSPISGQARIIAGAIVGGLIAPENVLSIQATSSALHGDPRYLSLAGRIEQPTGARQQMEASFDAVRTRRDFDAFETRFVLSEASLGYRLALPTGWLGNVRGGAEARWARSSTRFGGEAAFSNRFSIYQLYLGYDARVPSGTGVTTVDIAVHVSPGGVSRTNVAANLYAGRVRRGSSRYAYLSLVVARDIRLADRLSWSSQLIGQFSRTALPGSEQAGLGGAWLVRGYTLEDGALDRVAILRNEMRLAIAPPFGRQQISLLLYGLADAAIGEDLATGRRRTALSLGAGLTSSVWKIVDLRIEAARAMMAADVTRAGNTRLLARVTARF